jgi:cytochrome P450
LTIPDPAPNDATTDADRGRCPFHSADAVTLPSDGTPLLPSAALTELRERAPAVPLRYADGHEGWLVTRYELAKAVLGDPRFSVATHRFPVGPAEVPAAEVDELATQAITSANLLALDGDQHLKMRRSVMSRFSFRAVRGQNETVHEIVADQLERLVALGAPADLTVHYAQPISARVHCHVLGVPPELVDRFTATFVQASTTQQKFDFIRDALRLKLDRQGEDVLSDLLGSQLTRAEIEGICLVLMTSGRDSVAYLIATATVALLSNPQQLAALRDDPELIAGAVEEFVRFGSMFVTVFPRTATEELSLDGVHIERGQSVSVSQVAANRDERRFAAADRFDVTRDASGHLGFGHGQHGCIGQQLARLEIREAISQLIRRLPGLHLVDAEQTRPMPFAHDVATYEAGHVVIGW